MPESTSQLDPEKERRLGEAIAVYLAAMEADQTPGRESFLASYPDLAAELAEFIDHEERVNRLVAPVRATETTQAAVDVGAAEGLANPEETVPSSAPGSHVIGMKAVAHPAAGGNGAADEPLAAGTRVRYFGDYELRKLIGKGGMGLVYQAKQLSLNRLVALKMIRAGLWADDDEIRRFRNEAEAVANLDHSRIVTIHEVGQLDGQHYFSMKLVDGPSLADRLDRYTADPSAAAHLVADVARAVHHAHQRGILHRDLKPSNIVLDPEGRPHVTDFGLAKRIEGDSSLSASGAILGTPQYMSPEQASGRKGTITTAADVYGLGAILYATLAGRPPFQADDVVDTLEQVRGRAPERPSALNPRVERDLETICLKCLEKEPKRRYDSASALADDLERYLRGEPILARRTGPWERLRKWSRRHPAAAALVGMSGVAALTLAGLALALSIHSQLRSAYAEKDAALARELNFLYLNRVIFAERELNDNNPYRAESLLDECPEEQRNWEWHHLKRLCHTELFSVAAHKGHVISVEYSPDGRLIAAGGSDGLRICDAETGREVRRIQQTYPGECNAAFSPDGKRTALVTGARGRPGRVQLYEVATGRPVLEIPLNAGNLAGICFSPDGREIAVTSGELESGGWVHIRDAATGRERRIIPLGDEPAYKPKFSPDGTQVLAVVGSSNPYFAHGMPNQVRVWDVASGRAIHRLVGHTAPTMWAAFSPDGGRIVTSSYDATVRIWDASDGRCLSTYRGHADTVNGVAFSPDGQRVASASDDGSVRIWDAETGRDVLVLRGHRAPYTLSFRHDGSRLATCGFDGQVKVWDSSAAKEVRTLEAHKGPACAAFSHDGRRLVTGGEDRMLKVWEVHSGQLLFSWEGHAATVCGVAFNRDGSLIASAAGDWRRSDLPGEVKVWDAATGRVIHSWQAHRGIAWTVAFSPDGLRLASGGGEFQTPGQEVIVWDVVTGHKLRSFDGLGYGVAKVAFSPDGHQLAATVGNDIRMWDAETGRDLGALGSHADRVSSLAFSPDGRRVVSGSESDQTVKVWDAVMRRELFILKGHKYLVFGVAFSPDGRRIASCGGDRTIKLWDSETGQELLALRGQAGYVRAVAFSPDGLRIASAHHSGQVKIWDGSPIQGGAR
jgi:WD40 repeat protein/serine/threonine protein kinase